MNKFSGSLVALVLAGCATSPSLRHMDLHSQTEEGIRRTVQNNEYVAHYCNSHAELTKLVDQPQLVREHIRTRLGNLPHFFSHHLIQIGYSEEDDVIEQFSEGQLLRVYLLLEALQDKAFVEAIGREIEADIANPYTEHGGLIVVNEQGRLALQPVESTNAIKRNTQNNNNYHMHEDVRGQPHVVSYHVHALGDDYLDEVGPSTSTSSDACDFRMARYFIAETGAFHDVVFEKLIGNTFNVDYYGGEDTVQGVRILRFGVLDLGCYGYEK